MVGSAATRYEERKQIYFTLNLTHSLTTDYCEKGVIQRERGRKEIRRARDEVRRGERARETESKRESSREIERESLDCSLDR